LSTPQTRPAAQTVFFMPQLTALRFEHIIHYKQKRSTMYAIININTQVINYYTTENAASEACRVYNVLPDHNVYIIDFNQQLIEQL
jgi:hypothetical protein